MTLAFVVTAPCIAELINTVRRLTVTEQYSNYIVIVQCTMEAIEHFFINFPCKCKPISRTQRASYLIHFVMQASCLQYYRTN